MNYESLFILLIGTALLLFLPSFFCLLGSNTQRVLSQIVIKGEKVFVSQILSVNSKRDIGQHRNIMLAAHAVIVAR